jgi:hypothetical protein
MKSKLLNRFWIMLAVLGALTIMPDWANSAPDDVARIEGTIEKIKEASTTERQDGARYLTERQYAAMKLTDFIRSLDPSDREGISSGIVDDIAAFLRDEDGYIRYQAAAALGFIGVPTMRAVPALLEALKDVQFGSRSMAKNAQVSEADVIIGILIMLKICTPSPGDPRSACNYLLR